MQPLEESLADLQLLSDCSRLFSSSEYDFTDETGPPRPPHEGTFHNGMSQAPAASPWSGSHAPGGSPSSHQDGTSFYHGDAPYNYVDPSFHPANSWVGIPPLELQLQTFEGITVTSFDSSPQRGTFVTASSSDYDQPPGADEALIGAESPHTELSGVSPAGSTSSSLLPYGSPATFESDTEAAHNGWNTNLLYPPVHHRRDSDASSNASSISLESTQSHPHRAAGSSSAVSTEALPNRLFPVNTSAAAQRASTARRVRDAIHACQLCSGTFTALNGLKNHMYRHFNVRPFSCTFCGDSFRTKATQQRHTRTKHLANI
ncbi:unnamed protein product [Mycena citricolor]|uniref:C2H2-type domain-containing protein n=1 Tax=Mycena citricolor TaxID=2018698 RepID=A0AAD2H6K2_9AGAR|nr:unnamed protein product [Mycena citricolor]